jgi:hypothetical protein
VPKPVEFLAQAAGSLGSYVLGARLNGRSIS